jgi:anaerobic ribonucleoside-triphosphate reductase
MQELIYNLNVPSRWGTQTPFTNLTFDWICPEDLREQVPVIAGKEVSFAYGDCQAEMDMINRAYIDVMMAGDAKGRVFTFPIPTYNMTEDFDWTSPNAELLFEMTAKYGCRISRTSSIRNSSRTRSAPCAAACSWICANCSSEATACLGQPSRPARWAWSPSTARAWVTCTKATSPAC